MPASVITYCGMGSLCQSKEECGGVSLYMTVFTSTSFSPLMLPRTTCELPSVPVYSRKARIISLLLAWNIVDVENRCGFGTQTKGQPRIVKQRLPVRGNHLLHLGQPRPGL